VREHPLLMKGPLVRATLEGRKTQTRRPVKTESLPDPGFVWAECLCREIDPSDTPCLTCLARFPGIPEAGDRLWVRETWGIGSRPCPVEGGREGIEYRADEGFLQDDISLLPLHSADPPDGHTLDEYAKQGWRPSIHMPRWACRLVLPLVSVRVERVQDITEEDARAEGIRRTENGWTDGATGYDVTSARAAFQELWASIYGQASWDANPWVWVAEWKEWLRMQQSIKSTHARR